MHLIKALLLFVLIFSSNIFAFKVHLKSAKGLSACKNVLTSSLKMAQAYKYDCAYVYSTYWGWIDISHFGGASLISTKISQKIKNDLLSLYAAIIAGESHEQYRKIITPGGGGNYDYEDLISNFLGASFQYLYKMKHYKDSSFQDSVYQFFLDIEVVEDPMLYKNAVLLANEKNLKNRTYIPKLNTKSSFSRHNSTMEKLNLLRLQALAFINTNTLGRETLMTILHYLSPSFRKLLKDIDEGRAGGS